MGFKSCEIAHLAHRGLNKMADISQTTFLVCQIFNFDSDLKEVCSLGFNTSLV